MCFRVELASVVPAKNKIALAAFGVTRGAKVRHHRI